MAVWSITNTVEISKNKRFDSEFFHPDFLTSEKKVMSTGATKKLGELGRFLIGPFGSAFHVSNYDPTSEYRYIRGKDVKPFALLDGDNVYMPENDFNRLGKYAVIPNDLLISVVGTLGNVAIVPENIKGIFSCKSTVFRDPTIDPYYLLAYFNSKYGRDCLLRRQRGAIQTGLNKDDLKTVPVPTFSSEEHMIIGNLIRNALKLSDKSKSLYRQAQNILEKELGMDQLVLEKLKSYEISFSEILGSVRADPEFFHIKYDPILNAIKEYKGGVKPLYQLSKIVGPNFNPTKHNNSFSYIEIGDIDISDGSYTSNVVPAKDLPANAKIMLSGGELIISQVRPTRGAISLIDEDLKENTICSGAFYTCSIINKEQREIIFLYLRIVKEVFEKYCGGTSYPTIDGNYLKNFLIPLFDANLSKRISELIIKSKQAKKESEQLLEQAIKRSEDLIEGAIEQ
ncbi:hypothetical protein ACFYKT_19270 [Cytobacillus sp. FJAT-53684]|uniref:Type I restriction modification DNA specificity domain-containing protein n=1 Tax=Cytobacillus mangrovibacter TaxID=3299024 RepID=A0ABW6K4C6_9BACI